MNANVSRWRKPDDVAVNMKRPVIISVCFHLTVFALASLSFVFWSDEPPEPTEIVMNVDIMDFAEISTAPVRDMPDDSKSNEPPPPKKPTYNTSSSVPDLLTPEEPDLSDIPTPEAEKPDKPQIEAPPKPKNKPKQKPKPKPKVEEKPKEEEKPKQDDDQTMDNLLRSVLNEEDPNRSDQADNMPDSAGQTSQISNYATDLTNSEVGLLNNHMSKCWNFDIGAKNAKDLVVSVRVYLNPDMTVREVESLESARNAYHQAAIDNARKALLNSVCNKLPIPAEKYAPSKVFIFDPRDMI